MTSKPAMAALVAGLVVIMYVAGAYAQSGCTTAIIGLSPCLGFITGNSTDPSSNCCSQLGSVVKSEPQCLCMILNGGASQYGLSINETKALAMPDACKVQTPPASLCKTLVAGPTASPTPTSSPTTQRPTASPTTPGSSSATPSTTGGAGSKVTPGSKATPGATASAGSTAKMSFSLGFFLILLASCA